MFWKVNFCPKSEDLSQKGDFSRSFVEVLDERKVNFLVKYWQKGEFLGLMWSYSEYFEKMEFPPKMDFFQSSKKKSNFWDKKSSFFQRKVEILVRNRFFVKIDFPPSKKWFFGKKWQTPLPSSFFFNLPLIQ